MYDYFPMGKYHYKCLPMEVSISPEIFQHKMKGLFQGFEFICAYIDDLLVFKKVYWKYNVHKLEHTLNKFK